MKLQLLLIAEFLLLFLFTIFAQDPVASTNISTGRILTTDGKKINFSKLTLGSDEYEYVDKKSGKKAAIEAIKVLSLEKEAGNQAVLFGASGGLMGLLGSAQGVLEANRLRRDLGQESVDGTPIILGLTAGFGLLGAMIGAGEKKYKSAYTGSTYGSHRYKPDVRFIVVSSPIQGAGIGLRYRM